MVRWAMDKPDPKKPHWAWPHVIGVLIAIIAYFVIFRFTGDSDLFYGLGIAIAMGGVGWTVAWTYLFPPDFLRKK